jgi:solute carrier family 13 (sodium-dependent dicarboxylate transporter), member 2/3/5
LAVAGIFTGLGPPPPEFSPNPFTVSHPFPLPHDNPVTSPSVYGLRQWSGWVLGPLPLLITLLADPPAGLTVAGWHTVGAALLMAALWICESIPIPATALLPLVLFPALGMGDIKTTTAPYANPIIFLFLGGFVIALAMQRWNLHRRVAINLIGAIGTRPARIIGGFLLSSALVSMWVSNTATALMMLPIAISVVQLVPEHLRQRPEMKSFGTALLLAVAYGSTTGGMATLIGTPPNALLAGYLSDIHGYNIGFGRWMLIGVPVMLVTLPVVYWVLTRFSFKLDSRELPGMRALIVEEKKTLGRFSRGELSVALVFTGTALCWIFQPLITRFVPLASDTTIAMSGALILFFIPTNIRKGEFAMNWESAKGIPWDVLLLFGGGLSLAGAIEKHGVAKYLGSLCSSLEGVPMLLTVAIICFGILMLTELTSNTATAATFLPIVAAVAISLGQNPLLFLIPTALAANCSFMLPVGTPPNAIVFGSGLITLPQMARAGMILNVVMVPIIIGLVLLLGPWAFNLHIDLVPDWVRH